MTKGLPLAEKPSPHEVDPPCKRCTHYYFQASDRELRYPRCGRAAHAQQCRYERHEEGECGPKAKFFKERAV